jgi:hypothetical protein
MYFYPKHSTVLDWGRLSSSPPPSFGTTFFQHCAQIDLDGAPFSYLSFRFSSC